MEISYALILGLVQGLTEMLPISSSAHLVLLPWLFGWKEFGLTFDVALHVGTTISIIVFFWKDWMELIKAFFQSLKDRSIKGDYRKGMVWYILFACVPAGIAGLLGEEYIEQFFRNPLPIATMLIAMGAFLIFSEYISNKRKRMQQITFADAMIIGFAQMLALCPGVSRSGITITAGMLIGYKREDAARFSFLLATPIIVAAGLLKFKGIITDGLPTDLIMPFIIGMVASAISGYYAIKYLLLFVQKNPLNLFAYYRFAFGAIVLFVYWVR